MDQRSALPADRRTNIGMQKASYGRLSRIGPEMTRIGLYGANVSAVRGHSRPFLMHQV
ncbi:hypothetical protein [Sphingobacterium olei]|uniref:hypothetical protein n=1 Tax=Sphingobacterium olei TaxID=2571155 RepID=UPI00138FC3AA|nr:hypothetical protein [Sphingobacterium olei]